jgi:hypothetical protein
MSKGKLAVAPIGDSSTQDLDSKPKASQLHRTHKVSPIYEQTRHLSPLHLYMKLMLSKYHTAKPTHQAHGVKKTAHTPPPSPSGIHDQAAYSPDNSALSCLEAGTATPLKFNRSITGDADTSSLNGDYQQYPLAEEIDSDEDYYAYVFLKATCIALLLLYVGTRLLRI